MTLRKDDIDQWLEDALVFLRDELRKNTVVGLKANAGAKLVEVGSVNIEEVSHHPESQPSIWIWPMRSSPDRGGNVIDHRVQLEIQVFGTTANQPLAALADGQADHRKLTGKVWNEILHLRDIGITNGHWQDWWASGDIEWVSVPIDDRSVLRGRMRYSFLAEKVWLEALP